MARIAERGLAKKEKCGADRRGAFVAVTPTGGKETGSCAQPRRCVRRLFVDVVTRELLDVIADVAEAVLARLDGGTAAA